MAKPSAQSGTAICSEQPGWALGHLRTWRAQGAKLLDQEYSKMAPDSNYAHRLGAAASIPSAGILELGVDLLKNCAAELRTLLDGDQPGVVLGAVAQNQQLFNITVTLTPLGVASEYTAAKCLPASNSCSCVAPTMGRLMLLGAHSPGSIARWRAGVGMNPVISGSKNRSKLQRRAVT